jgi:hypothetical protein
MSMIADSIPVLDDDVLSTGIFPSFRKAGQKLPTLIRADLTVRCLERTKTRFGFMNLSGDTNRD